MKQYVLRAVPALLTLLPVTACHGPWTDGGLRAYTAQGTIEHISADRHVATVQHEAIPGYMMAMTMDFPVRNEHLLDGLTRGDQIRFTLDVTGDDSWIAGVQRTGHVDLPDTDTSATNTAPALNPGDLLPDAAFMAEDGRHVHLSDFRGKVIVFTFFFTRCPLPNYCPLMNHNFAEARSLLLADPHAPDNWQFLSISFDPEFDTPQVLASCAGVYRHGSKDRWLFVSATSETLAHFAAPLGLMIMRQDNNISHNLRTVVVDPNGRIFRQYDDNLWNPAQLAGLVRDAAQAPAEQQP